MIPKVVSINYSQIRFRLNSEYLTITIVCTVVLFGVDMVLRTSEKGSFYFIAVFCISDYNSARYSGDVYTNPHFTKYIYIYFKKI